jgi:hypothetical protein
VDLSEVETRMLRILTEEPIRRTRLPTYRHWQRSIRDPKPRGAVRIHARPTGN